MTDKFDIIYFLYYNRITKLIHSMRFFQISWTLSKYTIFYKLTIYRHEIFGQRLKRALEDLGITFIKIGQIISMRSDLLSKENSLALRQLLDRVNPIPLPEIYQILEAEYQQPHQLIFKKFHELPLGSASVSQVHKAELFDGSIVAVKIKRPRVDIKFAADIRVMKKLARIGEWLSLTMRNIQAYKLVEYFEDWIKQDLDFRNEVSNIKKIAGQYAFATDNFRSDLGRAIFPRPFEDLCTANIIVMDFMDGIPMSQKEKIMANPQYDAQKSIKSYANAALRNWFREDTPNYYFQADPHLSNILALPGGDAASIDFGLIASLSKKEARICQDLIIAVYLKDLKRSLAITADMIGVTEAQLDVMKPDFEKYLEQTSKEGFGFWFLEVVRMCNKHNFKFPLYLATFGRTNLILDGLIQDYLPDQTTLDILGEELHRQALKEIWKNAMDADWLKLSYSLSQKIKEGPQLISKFIDNPLSVISDFIRAVKNSA